MNAMTKQTQGRKHVGRRILANAAILVTGACLSFVIAVYFTKSFPSVHVGVAGLTAFSIFSAGWWTASRRRLRATHWPPLSKLHKIAVVFVALVLAIVCRTFLFQPFYLHGASLKPNALDGEYFVVTKYSYGFSRHSIPFSPSLFNGRIFAFFRPERGDIVVFKLPRDNVTDFVARIIGLPGDRVQMIDGRLYLNGVIVPRDPIANERAEDKTGREVEVPTYTETLPRGAAHTIIQIEGDRSLISNTELFVVPADHYFVMGDNRDDTMDSRISPEFGGVGFVPFENIVGRVTFILWPRRNQVGTANPVAIDADWTACVQEQDRDRSIRACTEILARGNAESPQNRAIAYTSRGSAYYAKGDYDSAILGYDQAIRLDRKFAIAFGNRGLAYFAKGDYDYAFADYDQAIRLDPQFADALRNRGLAFERRGDAVRARNDFEAALAARPGDRVAMEGLGRLAKDVVFDADWTACTGEPDRGLQRIRGCTEILARGNAESPQNRAIAYTGRGLAYYFEGNHDLAIADFDQAILLDPKDRFAYANRGNSYSTKGDYVRAIADYDQAILLNPKDAITYGNRGKAYVHEGNYGRAIADYDQAILLDPKYVDALGNRGLAFERRGDVARAEADFEAALAARPGDRVAMEGLARLGTSAAPTVAATTPVQAVLLFHYFVILPDAE